ncbi:hypothetical protein FRX31_023473 [Thalictrum thalictroides]|uniref:Uncharacterized protein n=1 Tax=Thalictrum thalictroides TaxID=46969 RepID=A0A7J6VRX5_THATH|nr:hypothetical protein FRX31_023473 [Thalictrum thalictroides]
MAKGKTAKQLAMQALKQCQASHFTKEIIDHKLPSNLNVLKFDQYNGIGNPTYHIKTKELLKVFSSVKEDYLLCLQFQSSLTGPSIDYFHKIPPGTIGSFGRPPLVSVVPVKLGPALDCFHKIPLGTIGSPGELEKQFTIFYIHNQKRLATIDVLFRVK